MLSESLTPTSSLINSLNQLRLLLFFVGVSVFGALFVMCGACPVRNKSSVSDISFYLLSFVCELAHREVERERERDRCFLEW